MKARCMIDLDQRIGPCVHRWVVRRKDDVDVADLIAVLMGSRRPWCNVLSGILVYWLLPFISIVLLLWQGVSVTTMMNPPFRSMNWTLCCNPTVQNELYGFDESCWESDRVKNEAGLHPTKISGIKYWLHKNGRNGSYSSQKASWNEDSRKLYQ